MDLKSKEFLKLKKDWYKKLKDSGFEDIERSEDMIKSPSILNRYTNDRYHNEITLAAKAEYYRAVGHFLYDHRFKNATEKRIWQLHGEALSIRNIVKTLEKENLWFVEGGTPHKRAVHETIQKLVKSMMKKIEKERETSE